MKAAAISILLALVALSAQAQDCERSTRNYEVSRNSMRPDAYMIEQAERQMRAACGYGPASAAPQPRYAPEQAPQAPRHPGQLVNCDQAGCWGSANGVRYNFVAGGNLQGTNGSFCSRGAGNNFSCN